MELGHRFAEDRQDILFAIESLGDEPTDRRYVDAGERDFATSGLSQILKQIVVVVIHARSHRRRRFRILILFLIPFLSSNKIGPPNATAPKSSAGMRKERPSRYDLAQRSSEEEWTFAAAQLG
jgi:hypothetical protein